MLQAFIKKMLTLVVLVVGVATDVFQDQAAYLMAVSLICLVGIPHGASDHLLFINISRKNDSNPTRQYLKFFSMYIGVILGYAVLWNFAPFLSFCIFIIVSFYHFGQENLHHIKWRKSVIKYLSLLFSGIFVLATPLLADMKTAIPIINALAHVEIQSLMVDPDLYNMLAVGCGMSYGTYLLFLFVSRNISKDDFRSELLNWILLFPLFMLTPLLIAFTVYFALWHAIPSMVQQIRFIRGHDHHYSTIKHLKRTLPFSIISIVFVFWGAIYLDSGNLASMTAMGFKLLSVITLPHILIMEKFHSVEINHDLQNDDPEVVWA